MTIQSSLLECDQSVAKLIHQELSRQETHLELIASENFASKAVMEAQGSVLTNKYAEGLPNKRYYGGCEYIDGIEQLAIERAKNLFGAKWANVQPHSGAQANFAVFLSLLKPGDTIMGMDLSHGGHLTHGSPVNVSGKWFKTCHYEVDKKTEMLDMDAIRKKAIEIAIKTAEKFNMVGLLAVELFLTKQGDILINEVAPRPHNSGHHTIECCMTSQFDQHLRSILNLPLGETELIIPGIMVNLVGENMIEGNVIYQNINDIFDIPGVFVHIYGKKKSRLNRKMGHITIVNKDIDKAIEIGKKIKKKIKVVS